MDYYHWEETHRVHCLCTCRLLSATKSIFTDLVGVYRLGISFSLRHRINNSANKQTEQRTILTGLATVR